MHGVMGVHITKLWWYFSKVAKPQEHVFQGFWYIFTPQEKPCMYFKVSVCMEAEEVGHG